MKCCDDCPPFNYSSDRTRCLPCPYRQIEQAEAEKVASAKGYQIIASIKLIGCSVTAD